MQIVYLDLDTNDICKVFRLEVPFPHLNITFQEHFPIFAFSNFQDLFHCQFARIYCPAVPVHQSPALLVFWMSNCPCPDPTRNVVLLHVNLKDIVPDWLNGDKGLCRSDFIRHERKPAKTRPEINDCVCFLDPVEFIEFSAVFVEPVPWPHVDYFVPVVFYKIHLINSGMTAVSDPISITQSSHDSTMSGICAYMLSSS